MRIKFFSSSFSLQPKPPSPIFTINTSDDVVSRKNVPFGGPDTKYYISIPFFSQNAISDGTKFRVKGLNDGNAHL